MLRINECGSPARFLHLGNNVERNRRFTGGFRPEDFHNSSARNAADSDCIVERERTGVNRLHLHVAVLSQTHDRACAKRPFNLR